MTPNPSWRKPVGMLAILGIIIGWTVIIASFSMQISQLHGIVQALIYTVAGIIWIIPLRPLLSWMETGKWRE